MAQACEKIDHDVGTSLRHCPLPKSKTTKSSPLTTQNKADRKCQWRPSPTVCRKPGRANHGGA